MELGQNAYGGRASGGNIGGGDEFSGLMVSQEDFGKRRRTLMKRVVVGVVILLITMVTVGIIFGVINSYNAARENMKREAKELYGLLGWASYAEQCPSVTNNINDEYVSNVEYESYITRCRENARKIQNNINNVASLSDDGEYKSLYTELKTAIDNNMIMGEELEKALEICLKWHEWRLKLEKLSIYQTPEDIERFASEIVDLGNETLANYVEEWATARTRLVDTYITDGGGSVSYEDARKYYDTVVNNTPDVPAIVGFGEDGGRELYEAIIKYNNYVEENL